MNNPQKKRKWIFEAKHTNAFRKAEDCVPYWYAQLQHNIKVTDADGAYLSVFFGNDRYEYFEVERDDEYIAALVEIERHFWNCVETGEEPVAFEAPKPKVDAVKKVDMTNSNAWAEQAHVWLSNKGYAKSFEASVKEIKAMVEEDVAEAYGHGIKASRSKSGAISIRETK